MAWHRSAKDRLARKAKDCKKMHTKPFLRYINLLIQKKMDQKFDPRIAKSYLVDLIIKLSHGVVMTDTQFVEAKGIFAFYKKVSEEEDFPIKNEI